MKKTLLATLFGLALLALAPTVQAQTAPALLPNAVWCTGTGQPGPNQFTIFVSNSFDPLPYCEMVTVGGGMQHIPDLTIFGWTGANVIGSVWTGPNVVVFLYGAPNFGPPNYMVNYNIKQHYLTGLRTGSMQFFHM